tara:strand:+ start:2875 stop:3351 length:477 start_codon:yes stop_codon:yes gene_type:complete
MHDLVETGRRIFDAITKQKPADAGDLAQGIERIIEELRSDPDQFKDKLDHLEGLFKELVYGEEYALREEATEKPEDFIWASGVMPNQQTFNFPISGAISGVVTPPPSSPPMPMPPVTGINNPCGEIPLGEPEECSLPTPEPEEKPKKPWWKFWGGSNE